MQQPALASTYNIWPKKDGSEGFYKFSSILIMLGQDLEVTERSTYSLLELLGDIGGLFDSLRILGEFIVAPVAAVALKIQLLTSLFHRRQPKK